MVSTSVLNGTWGGRWRCLCKQLLFAFCVLIVIIGYGSAIFFEYYAMFDTSSWATLLATYIRVLKRLIDIYTLWYFWRRLSRCKSWCSIFSRVRRVRTEPRQVHFFSPGLLECGEPWAGAHWDCFDWRFDVQYIFIIVRQSYCWYGRFSLFCNILAAVWAIFRVVDANWCDAVCFYSFMASWPCAACV